MKKLLTILTVVLLFSLSFVFYQTKAEDTTFFDAIENLNELESYNVHQSFYGDFQVDDWGDKINGEYRLTITETVNNKKSWEADKYSRINGIMTFNYKGDEEYKPFDKLVMELRGEVISIFNNSIYLKLDHLGISAEGIEEGDQEEIDEVLSAISNYQNTWYRIDMSEFTDIMSDEVSDKMYYDINEDLTDPTAIAERFEEKGFKEGLMEVIDEMLVALKDSGEITETDLDEISKAVEHVLETKFFTTKNIESGRSAGFTTFRFNRSSIIQLAKTLANEFGEDLSSYDINELRSALNNISMSGMYRMNEIYGICDNFLIKFSLRNLDILKKLRVNYRYKVSGINNGSSIKAPANFIELEDSGIPLPFYYYDDDSNNWGDEEWDSYYWEDDNWDDWE